MFNYRTAEEGIEEYTIELNALYPNKSDLMKFEERWEQFYLSDPTNPDVLFKDGHTLRYLSESLIPTKVDSRMPVLLLLGNPAPHSIKHKMFFSYEGTGQPHRVWRIFRDTGLLEFNVENNFELGADWNQQKKKQLLDLEYKSPFRIGMLPYFSLPSTASTPPWTGVAGIRRLFGARALREIEIEEQKRVKAIAEIFMPENGLIIAFQTDAFNGLKPKDSLDYSLEQALQANLITSTKFNNAIRLAGVPPTRSLQGKVAKAALVSVIQRHQII